MNTTENIDMPAETTAPTTNGFSWRRVAMVARFYYPKFRMQLWLYPLVGLLVGSLLHLKEFFFIFTLFYGILVMAIGFMVYWAPLVLTGKSRVVEIALPARRSEKIVVLFTYFLIILPLITNGVYYLTSGLISLATTGTFTILDPNSMSMLNNVIEVGPLCYALACLNVFLPVSAFLFVVCRSDKPKAWQGILLSTLTTFAVGLCAGIYVAFQTLRNVPKLGAGAANVSIDNEVIERAINLPQLINLTFAVMLTLTLLFLWLAVRGMRKVQA